MTGGFMQYEDVQRSALENNSFRKVLFTNKHSQVVLMSLPPGEDIGSEVHDTVDQVLVFVKGSGKAVVGSETHNIGAGDMFAVPAGTEHDFINTGSEALKLFTVYSPPEHRDGVVHATKADALAHPEG
jgi:mannose-6-phosphate isomerase-like protein (cupin superfamily)